MNHNHFVPANGSSVGSSAVPDQGQPTGANTGSTRKPKSAGKVVDLKTKEAVHPHAKIPHADLDWVLTQNPPVIRLFIESWRCESFGKQERLLKTTLRGENLREAKRVIEQVGLFKYVPVMELNKKHRWTVVGWKCENLHGYYTDYWDVPAESGDVPAESGDVPAESRDVPAESRDVPAESRDVPAESGKKQAETIVRQGVQNSQPRFNHVLTTHQPPTKVVGGVVSIPSEETGSPLGGSPTMRDGVKQEESPQGAPDCPTLSGGIDSTQSSASEQTSLGAEPPDPQTQSFEAGLHGGEFHSPPRREPPLSASQGEEAVVQFLEGKAQTPISEDSLATLSVTKAADLKPQDLDGDNSSGAGAGVKNCANEPASNQDNVQIPASTVTIDVIADPEQIQQHRQWIKKNFFTRPPYPGRERLEEWLVHQLLYASPPQRDSFTKAFRTAERQRPAASLSYLIEKALPVLGQKDLKLPKEL